MCKCMRPRPRDEARRLCLFLSVSTRERQGSLPIVSIMFIICKFSLVLTLVPHQERTLVACLLCVCVCVCEATQQHREESGERTCRQSILFRSPDTLPRGFTHSLHIPAHMPAHRHTTSHHLRVARASAVCVRVCVRACVTLCVCLCVCVALQQHP